MRRTFSQVSAIILTIEAAVLLAKGNLWLSAQPVAEIWASQLGGDLEVVRALACQAGDTRIGVVLLLLALIMQMACLLSPPDIRNQEINMQGVVWAIFFSLVCFAGALFMSGYIAESMVQEVIEIRQEASITSGQGQITRSILPAESLSPPEV